MNPILRAADLLWTCADQVDTAHAQPGTIEAMRGIATQSRAEFAKLQRSPGAALDALIKSWATRELERLPRALWSAWIRTGTIPRALQDALAGLPEPVAALVGAHVADEIDDCECCKRRAPCRMMSDDGSDSGDCDYRCAWGCPAPEHDPAALREWSGEAPL